MINSIEAQIVYCNRNSSTHRKRVRILNISRSYDFIILVLSYCAAFPRTGLPDLIEQMRIK